MCWSCRAWIAGAVRGTRVSRLHRKFARRGALWQRAWRTGLLAVVNLALFVAIWLTFAPNIVQARGNIAYWCYFVVLYLTLTAMAALLMFVVDSTLLSYRFVVAFRRHHQRVWPDGLVDNTARQWGWGPVAVDTAPAAAAVRQAADWSLFIRFIDDVTNVVARMIYYPFVVLLVLIVAQNRLFDDWHWNAPLAFMVLFIAGAAVVCAVLLQVEARRARRESLAALDELRRARVGLPTDPLREQLDQVRSDIDDLRTGAFASPSQNPVVKAVLLPLVGGGGLAVLEMILPYFQ